MNEFPRESRLKLFSYAVAALSMIVRVVVLISCYRSQRVWERDLRGPALNTERKVTLSYAASEFFATEDCRQDP